MAALVSGGGSKLNPNAPLFIPAAFREVEDFSPEWWELVKTSKWFHDYWLNQHQEHEQDNFNGSTDVDYDDDDIANLLPESFDLGIADEFSSVDAEWKNAEQSGPGASKKGGLELNAQTLIKNLSLKSAMGGARSPSEPAKYCEKAAQSVSPKCSPRRIQQPR